jgi:23S rRNA (guanosine2251-2'-O)-methyltransferase
MPNTNKIVVIAHNMRSCYNVGALLRVADGCGIDKVLLTGYTPYPMSQHDPRLPHLAEKVHKQIQKTALGAENTVAWRVIEDVEAALAELKQAQFHIVALEQAKTSTFLTEFVTPPKLAILLGEEVAGVPNKLLAQCNEIVEIPMLGQKESHNVVQATAMALFWMRFNH